MNDSWPLETALLEYLEGAWHHPDDEIWEVRGGRQHFTHSKVMAWLAFSCALSSAEQFGLPAPLDRWRQARDDVHALVCAEGYSSSLAAARLQSLGFTHATDLERASGSLSYRALTPAFIMVTQLANQGSDNICFGDSGGPDFVQINGREQLVAINVVVNSYSCEEVAWLYRLDTPQAREFLGQYVALP